MARSEAIARNEATARSEATSKKVLVGDTVAKLLCNLLIRRFAPLALRSQDATHPLSLPSTKTYKFFDFLINVLLRSVSQVVFASNPLSGALILISHLIDPSASSTVLYGLVCALVANVLCILSFSGGSGDLGEGWRGLKLRTGGA